ncbi:hypothetical protein CEXT_321221 [Caerostris extrusa]|uniref:Uncharacterized protein n=1 Tax=Caerostris extrusa TaxID=172846 RepID=A0AAV4Q1N2_CAEEX|nr:hypothetical protein CEXT_321221 [Caerostris extrusa]
MKKKGRGGFEPPIDQAVGWIRQRHLIILPWNDGRVSCKFNPRNWMEDIKEDELDPDPYGDKKMSAPGEDRTHDLQITLFWSDYETDALPTALPRLAQMLYTLVKNSYARI